MKTPAKATGRQPISKNIKRSQFELDELQRVASRFGSDMQPTNHLNPAKHVTRLHLKQVVAFSLLLASIIHTQTTDCQTTQLPETSTFTITLDPKTPVESTTKSIETNATVSDLNQPPPATEPVNASSNATNNKLRGVDFTLVDEIFDAVISEEEVVKRWKNMDSHIQDGMRAILKMLFPQIVSMSQDAKVSGECSGGILKWILSLRNLRSWAIKMLDATGKPSSGMFEGSLTMFGNYRQCLSIRAPDEDEIEITDQFEEYFRGQFCVIHLKPWMPIKRPFYHLNSTIEPLLRKNYKYYEKTLYDELAEIAIAFNFIDIRMDLCVPSTCTVADIQRVAELISKKFEMRAKVMRCDIASRETNPFSQIDQITYYWLIVPLVLVVISLVATLILSIVKFKDRCRKQPSEASPESSQSDSRSFVHILRCLSLVETLKDRIRASNKTTSVTSDDREDYDINFNETIVAEEAVQREPLALYGLRNLFVLWFIIVQMTVELKYQYLRESLPLRDMMISYWPFQFIVNSIYVFDSLILITAFTYSYTCLESTLKDLITYIINKYVRLILPIITIIAVTIITPILAVESPVWRNFVEEQAAVCKSTGYLDLFFLQNFISYDKICLPHTWLFCAELQLIVLSIPLLLLLKKISLMTEDSVITELSAIQEDAKKKGNRLEKICLFKVAFMHLINSKAGLLSGIFVAGGLFVNFYTVYINQLPPSWFYTFPDVAQKNYYFGIYVTKTWTHLSAFLIGLLAGHLCRTTLQLRNIRSLKARQSLEYCSSELQSSPGSSTNSKCDQQTFRPSNSSSTSTIMAMEMGSQQIDDSSTSENQSNNGQSKKNKDDFSKSLARKSSQMAALVCMLAIIFSTYNWSTKQAPSTLVAALYDASARLIWSIALVVLIIQFCLPNVETNRYSNVARLLSHPVCIFFGRLSFLAYLIAPYINTFVLAVQEQSLFPSLFMIFHLIVGNIVITYIIAFILAIVIEQPLRRFISRFVLGKTSCKQKGSISVFRTTISK